MLSEIVDFHDDHLEEVGLAIIQESIYVRNGSGLVWAPFYYWCISSNDGQDKISMIYGSNTYENS